MDLSLAYITCIPTHHQLPIGKALHDLLGDKFRMIFLNPVDEERLRMGWEDNSDQEWVIRTWLSQAEKEKTTRWLNEADVVVYGDVPIDLVRERILSGKLTFRYSERLFKRGFLIGFAWWFRRMCRDLWPLNVSNHHLLAVGPYSALDHGRIGMFKGRKWKSGYFTDVPQVPPLSREGDKLKIIWAGRMLYCKQVYMLIEAARRLKSSFPHLLIELIGDGPKKEGMIALARKYGLDGSVVFTSSMAPSKVREAMRQSGIYVMPSNYWEGWGAVINEAMGEGCCVVSSNGPGAAPWLIKHGETGFVFPNKDVNALCSILEELCHSPKQTREIGYRAWKSMRDEWSPEVAASRLVELSLGLLKKGPIPDFTSGPCSRT